MYGCILVVGGGMKFSGIATWLQNKIYLQIPYLYRAGMKYISFFLFVINFVYRAIGYNNKSTGYGFIDGCVEGCGYIVLFRNGSGIMDYIHRMGKIWRAFIKGKSSFRMVELKNA